MVHEPPPRALHRRERSLQATRHLHEPCGDEPCIGGRGWQARSCRDRPSAARDERRSTLRDGHMTDTCIHRRGRRAPGASPAARFVAAVKIRRGSLAHLARIQQPPRHRRYVVRSPPARCQPNAARRRGSQEDERASAARRSGIGGGARRQSAGGHRTVAVSGRARPARPRAAAPASGDRWAPDGSVLPAQSGAARRLRRRGARRRR